MNLESRNNNKAVLKLVVLCPDTFEYDGFVKSMRSIFGPSCVIEFLIV